MPTEGKTIYVQPDVERNASLSRRSHCAITAAIVVLCFAFVILLTLGVWYVNDDRRCDHDSSEVVMGNIVKEEYVVGIPRYDNYSISMVQNYVQVERARQQEYIVMKDPDKKHTMFILVIDRIKGMTYAYGSELGQCMVFPDSHVTLADSVKFLQLHDGQDIDKPTVQHTYKATSTRVNLNSLPAAMRMLCTEEKTSMMELAERDDWNEDIRLYHVCVCYHYCWCSYCEDINCWGQCFPTDFIFDDLCSSVGSGMEPFECPVQDVRDVVIDATLQPQRLPPLPPPSPPSSAPPTAARPDQPPKQKSSKKRKRPSERSRGG